MLSIGDKATEFCLPDQDNKQVCINELRGSWIVLYFYPKDNTSGCTTEALNFTSRNKEFETKKTLIFGISPDSITSHCNFIEKHDLGITLLSDQDHKVLEMYGAWGLKKNYGKEYMGVIRSTFLLNPDGELVAEWRNVRVKGHVDKVYEKLVELQQN